MIHDFRSNQEILVRWHRSGPDKTLLLKKFRFIDYSLICIIFISKVIHIVNQLDNEHVVNPVA